MQYRYLLIIFFAGVSGLVAQILLLRELLISFYGNELTIGIILANWLLSEAAGVFCIGYLVERAKNKLNLFIILQVLFCLFLAVSLYLSRVFKVAVGVPLGEAVGMAWVFWASLLVIFPVGFCHGGLFSSGAKNYAANCRVKEASAIGEVYSWESLGWIAGGIIFTFILLPLLTSFQICYILITAGLLASMLLVFKKKIKYLLYCALALTLLYGVSADKLHHNSLDLQFRQGKVLDYRNSVYGNVCVTKQRNQFTFFYNGLPAITTPYPDMQFVEEYGKLPLLFHPNPSSVLVIGSAAGGLLNEILQSPLTRVDYVELDPLIIGMLKRYPTQLTESEFRDKRLRIINTDARLFLKSNPAKYDLIMVGLSRPGDLTANRFFTQEFFSLARERLNPEGILSLWLPGSLAYLSQELIDLNSVISNALKSAFNCMRVIPGDYNIYLAGESDKILTLNSGQVYNRLVERKINAKLLIQSYLTYRLDRKWQEWFDRESLKAKYDINRDMRPIAVYDTLILWNKQFSSRVYGSLLFFKKIHIRHIFYFVLGLTFVFLLFLRRTSSVVAYSVFTTGFFSMLLNLILIFAYQAAYGCIYRQIALLVSVLMAGIAVGSVLMIYALKMLKHLRFALICSELIIILFTYLAGAKALAGAASLNYAALLFLCGFFTGLQFPLASKICLIEGKKTGEASGILYAVDLLGGWLAGVFGGVVLLPVLGLFNSCMVIIMFKISSLLVILKQKPLTKSLN